MLHALSECEVFKQKALEYQEQDASKSQLLMSVREECDALRSRIAQIELEVTTSREDHQRLVSEARRARSEAEELRQERDSLTQQVSTGQRQIEQMRLALAEALIRSKNPTSQSNNTSDTTSNNPDPVDQIKATANTVQHATAPGERNMCTLMRTPEAAITSTSAPLGIVRLQPSFIFWWCFYG
ncbi:unnamed protein product [Echinostoma caproni]|uniref:Uncharacterized protein n=1 Tax=Echinostoma caproni TaxID=27848 RepID=A0A3P8FS79_9TREM|nr:unnamed protein product [Echinostoma caproni]